jgi:hypothetical protein
MAIFPFFTTHGFTAVLFVEEEKIILKNYECFLVFNSNDYCPYFLLKNEQQAKLDLCVIFFIEVSVGKGYIV